MTHILVVLIVPLATLLFTITGKTWNWSTRPTLVHTFQNRAWKWSLLAKLWVWPGGSLITPVLYVLLSLLHIHFFRDLEVAKEIREKKCDSECWNFARKQQTAYLETSYKFQSFSQFSNKNLKLLFANPKILQNIDVRLWKSDHGKHLNFKFYWPKFGSDLPFSSPSSWPLSWQSFCFGDLALHQRFRNGTFQLSTGSLSWYQCQDFTFHGC